LSLVRWWAARGPVPRPWAAPRGKGTPPAVRARLCWLILGCYCFGAVALTWHLWGRPRPGRAQGRSRCKTGVIPRHRPVHLVPPV